MFCSNCGVAIYEGASACAACGRHVSGEDRSHAPARVAYANIWLRAVAAIIDVFVLVIPCTAAFVFAVAFLGMQPPSPDLPMGELPPMRVFLPIEVLFITVQWLYFAIMESSRWQGTLGKRALGIAVSDLNGARLSFARASGRFFGKMLSGMTFGLGYAMAAFTAKRQALHDLIVGSIVVRMP